MNCNALLRMAVLALAIAGPGMALGQGYPAKAVRIVVPFPPGAGADIEPVSMVASTPFVLMVHPSLPAKSVKDLIAIGSSRHETVERALAAVRPFCGPPQAAVLGRAGRVDILHAALANGISSHVLDFDDTHARAIHPSAPVLPALIAKCWSVAALDDAAKLARLAVPA